MVTLFSQHYVILNPKLSHVCTAGLQTPVLAKAGHMTQTEIVLLATRNGMKRVCLV